MARRDENGFTSQQANVWRVLEDGQWHSRAELYTAIDDEDRKVLNVHLTHIRRAIQQKGLMIACVQGPMAQFGYQLVRRLSPMKNGL